MMNFNEMAKNNGKTTFNGNEYVLTQQAYTNDGETYEAMAIRSDEQPDEDGFITGYLVTWNVVDSDAETEDCACDWDDPADVRECGCYNINDGRNC